MVSKFDSIVRFTTIHSNQTLSSVFLVNGDFYLFKSVSVAIPAQYARQSIFRLYGILLKKLQYYFRVRIVRSDFVY